MSEQKTENETAGGQSALSGLVMFRLLMDGISQWDITNFYGVEMVTHSSGYFYYKSSDAIAMRRRDDDHFEYWPNCVLWFFVLQWLAMINTWMVMNKHNDLKSGEPQK